MNDATAELLARYETGERSFRETNIDDDDALALDGATLVGADFSESFLFGTFRRADLRGASFRNANVKCCDFSYADLRDADFRGAAICSADFKGALLTGARIAGAQVYGAEMSDGELPPN